MKGGWNWLLDRNGTDAPKCNFFVFDALAAGGVAPGRVNGRQEIPTASGHWGNPKTKIEGYRPLERGERAKAGDVVSWGGHVGIVLASSLQSRILERGGQKSKDILLPPLPHRVMETRSW